MHQVLCGERPGQVSRGPGCPGGWLSLDRGGVILLCLLELLSSDLGMDGGEDTDQLHP